MYINASNGNTAIDNLFVVMLSDDHIHKLIKPMNIFCLFCLFRYPQKGFHCVHSEFTAAHAHNMSTVACDQEPLCEPRGKKKFDLKRSIAMLVIIVIA